MGVLKQKEWYAFEYLLRKMTNSDEKMPIKIDSPRLNKVGVRVNAAAGEEITSRPAKRARKRRIKHRLLTPELQELLKKYSSPDEITPVIVAIDKLKLRLEACVKDAMPGEQVRHLDNGVTLQLKNEIGTPLHRCWWDVFHDTRLVGTLETGGRSPNMARYDYLTLNNETIWQSGWSSGAAANVMTGLNAIFHSVANLDICIDGLNHMPQIFNRYIIDNMVNPIDAARIVRAKKGGAKNGTNVFDELGANEFDEKAGTFKHYYIGAKGADKRFVVYEKNQEITYISPHKEYIRDTWDMNGIDASGEVWRSELRLKGKDLDAFDITDLSQLESANFLLQIYKTATDGFVDFRVTDGKVNVNDAIKLDVLQFARLGVNRLTTVKKNLSVGLYKAKMAIHSAFEQCIKKEFQDAELVEAMKHVYNLVTRFNLREYVIRTVPRWMDKYRQRNDDDIGYLLAYV